MARRRNQKKKKTKKKKTKQEAGKTIKIRIYPSIEQKQIIKSTAPILKENGKEITSIFYKHPDNTVRNSIRKMYNIKEDDILMINIGAMTTNKGILLVIESLHILVNKMGKKEYKLMLKGSDDLYQCQLFLENYFENFKRNNVMTQSEIDNLLKKILILTFK